MIDGEDLIAYVQRDYEAAGKRIDPVFQHQRSARGDAYQDLSRQLHDAITLYEGLRRYLVILRDRFDAEENE